MTVFASVVALLYICLLAFRRIAPSKSQWLIRPLFGRHDTSGIKDDTEEVAPEVTREFAEESSIQFQEYFAAIKAATERPRSQQTLSNDDAKFILGYLNENKTNNQDELVLSNASNAISKPKSDDKVVSLDQFRKKA